jgi:hypothetical protein
LAHNVKLNRRKGHVSRGKQEILVHGGNFSISSCSMLLFLLQKLKFVCVMGNDCAPTVLVRKRHVDLLERAASFARGEFDHETHNSRQAF